MQMPQGLQSENNNQPENQTRDTQHGTKPEGDVSMRTIAMPRDTNANGDIFGGWLMSEMDLAGANHANRFSGGRVVTVAVESMTFIKPVNIGDEVTCYTKLCKKGRTSLKIKVEAWVARAVTRELEKVTEGMFTFVAIDKNKNKRALPDMQG
jgi:acyl-CoA thioesterase YciA